MFRPVYKTVQFVNRAKALHNLTKI